MERIADTSTDFFINPAITTIGRADNQSFKSGTSAAILDSQGTIFNSSDRVLQSKSTMDNIDTDPVRLGSNRRLAGSMSSLSPIRTRSPIENAVLVADLKKYGGSTVFLSSQEELRDHHAKLPSNLELRLNGSRHLADQKLMLGSKSSQFALYGNPSLPAAASMSKLAVSLENLHKFAGRNAVKEEPIEATPVRPFLEKKEKPSIKAVQRIQRKFAAKDTEIDRLSTENSKLQQLISAQKNDASDLVAKMTEFQKSGLEEKSLLKSQLTELQKAYDASIFDVNRHQEFSKELTDKISEMNDKQAAGIKAIGKEMETLKSKAAKKAADLNSKLMNAESKIVVLNEERAKLMASMKILEENAESAVRTHLENEQKSIDLIKLQREVDDKQSVIVEQKIQISDFEHKATTFQSNYFNLKSEVDAFLHLKLNADDPFNGKPHRSIKYVITLPQLKLHTDPKFSWPNLPAFRDHIHESLLDFSQEIDKRQDIINQQTSDMDILKAENETLAGKANVLIAENETFASEVSVYKRRTDELIAELALVKLNADHRLEDINRLSVQKTSLQDEIVDLKYQVQESLLKEIPASTPCEVGNPSDHAATLEQMETSLKAEIAILNATLINLKVQLSESESREGLLKGRIETMSFERAQLEAKARDFDSAVFFKLQEKDDEIMQLKAQTHELTIARKQYLQDANQKFEALVAGNLKNAIELETQHGDHVKALHEKISALEASIQSYSKEVDHSKVASLVMDEQLKLVRANNESLRSAQSLCEDKVSQSKEKINLLAQDNRAVSDKVVQLEAHIFNLEAELADYKLNEVKQIKSFSDFEDQLLEAKNALASITVELSASRELLTALERDKTRLQEEKTALITTKVELSENLAQSDAVTLKLQSKIQELNAKIVQLELHNNEMLGELATKIAPDTTDIYAKISDQFKDEIESLRCNLQMKSEELLGAEKRVAELSMELAIVENLKDEVKSQLETAQTLELQVSELTTNLKSAPEQIISLENTIGENVSEIAKLISSRALSENELSLHKNVIKQLTAEKQEMFFGKTELESRNQDMAAKMKTWIDADVKIDGLLQHNIRLQQEVSDLRKSNDADLVNILNLKDFHKELLAENASLKSSQETLGTELLQLQIENKVLHMEKRNYDVLKSDMESRLANMELKIQLQVSSRDQVVITNSPTYISISEINEESGPLVDAKPPAGEKNAINHIIPVLVSSGENNAAITLNEQDILNTAVQNVVKPSFFGSMLPKLSQSDYNAVTICILAMSLRLAASFNDSNYRISTIELFISVLGSLILLTRPGGYLDDLLSS